MVTALGIGDGAVDIMEEPPLLAMDISELEEVQPLEIQLLQLKQVEQCEPPPQLG